MLNLKIKELLLAKSIEHPQKWLEKHGISKRVAQKLISGKQKNISRDHTEIICLHAFCTPNDLYGWVPDNSTHDVAEHPLQKLRNVHLPQLAAELKLLSTEQLHEYKRMIDELKRK